MGLIPRAKFVTPAELAAMKKADERKRQFDYDLQMMERLPEIETRRIEGSLNFAQNHYPRGIFWINGENKVWADMTMDERTDVIANTIQRDIERHDFNRDLHNPFIPVYTPAPIPEQKHYPINGRASIMHDTINAALKQLSKVVTRNSVNLIVSGSEIIIIVPSGKYVSIPAKVEQDFNVTLPYDVFAQLINLLNNERIDLKYTPDTNTLQIVQYNSITNIKALDFEVFQAKGKANPKILQDKIAWVGKATDKGDKGRFSRPALSWSNRQQWNKDIVLVAANGFRAHVIWGDDLQALEDWNSYKHSAQFEDGFRMPDVQSILPYGYQLTQLSVDMAALKGAIKQAKGGYITLNFDGKRLYAIIHNKGNYRESTTAVNLPFEGESKKFNATFQTDYLNDAVSMPGNKSRSIPVYVDKIAVIGTDKQAIALIMPISVDKDDYKAILSVIPKVKA